MAVFFRLVATLGRILSWWGNDYVYAARWQLRGTLRPGRREDFASGEDRPIVIIPGVWEPWGFMRPVIDALKDAGHPVHVVPALGRNSRPVADAARVVAGFVADNDLTDVVLVAHSKGGLVGKYLMSELDDEHRITGMVAICTPFAGSDYARFMTSRTLRAFSPNDPTTLMLQKNLEVNARITTIAGIFDPHIPRIVELEGAANVRVEDGGHFRLLAHPDVLRAVVEVAGRPAAVQEQIVDAVVAAATEGQETPDAALPGAEASDPQAPPADAPSVP
ncbi:alpha/beta fold hydrolase [Microbacterium sp. NPDC019599]|uniref:esterase/lipase family protein n=1 Tax=Microbacterium sp. NPDC019599 TaxID=3154690 RepID=UPI0033F2C963